MTAVPKKATRPELQRERIKARERFLAGRKAAHGYGAALRAVARQVGVILRGLVDTQDFYGSAAKARQLLNQYADLLGPWARAVVGKMLGEVADRDAVAWDTHARTMGRALSKEIRNAPTGEAMRAMMTEQVDLITSLPREAADKVHALVIRSLSTGERAEEIADKVQKLGPITENRAMLIARTEVSSASTALTAARANYVGSEGYYWRTARDSEVRPLHKKLEGQFIRWDAPPVAGERGERAHAGAIYNCRCWPEPVLPDVIS